MGQKRSLLDSIPPVSSEEEDSDASDVEKQPKLSKSKPESEQESEQESEEESDDEEEEEKSKPVSITPPVVKKPSIPEPTTPEASSESDADDESGSDSDSGDHLKSPSASAFTIKPVSKPINDSKKQEPKSTGRLLSTPAKVTGKRASETQLNGKDSKVKKSKVLNTEEEDAKTDEKKSGGANRLWTEKDEIAVLNGLIRYKSEKGSDPLTDLGLFHEFVKGSIRADISKTQLSDKIKRLKKKYLTNLEKGENGEDPVFSRAHENRVFDLSKKIWSSVSKITNIGDDNGVIYNNTAKKSKKIEPKEESKAVVVAVEEPKTEQVKDEEKDFGSVYPRLNEMFNLRSFLSEDSKKFFEKNFSLIGCSKAKELNDKWKNLQIEEFEVYSKRMALMSEQTKLVLDAFKSSKN